MSHDALILAPRVQTVRFRSLMLEGVDWKDGHRVHSMRVSLDVDCAFLFIQLQVFFLLSFSISSFFSGLYFQSQSPQALQPLVGQLP